MVFLLDASLIDAYLCWGDPVSMDRGVIGLVFGY
jgi:hypothetical protein